MSKSDSKTRASGKPSAAKRVAVLYTSVRPQLEVPEKVREAEDLTSNAHAIQKALTGLGHAVRCFDFGDDVSGLVSKLRAFRPDVVFNLAEAPFGSYEKEPHAVALLELLGLPYTGNASFSLLACKNKAVTKDLLQAHGVPTPRYCVQATVPRKRLSLSFPVVVKPLRQDGSQGITDRSVVEHQAALRQSVAYVLENQRQEALVEEFVGGREFNVSVLGNGTDAAPYRVLPPGEYVYHSPRWRVCTFEAKWDEAHPSYAAVEAVYPARISSALRRKLEAITVQCARIFELTGYSRIDFRLDNDGQPQVLDVNPNPDVAPRMGMARAAETAGLAFPELLQEILLLGLARGKR
jgi:D-alanine-D-alanine ligase